MSKENERVDNTIPLTATMLGRVFRRQKEEYFGRSTRVQLCSTISTRDDLVTHSTRGRNVAVVVLLQDGQQIHIVTIVSWVCRVG